MGILINAKANLKVVKFESHHSGRLISVKVSRDKFIMNIVCVHLPTRSEQEKTDFIKLISTYMRENSEVILLGDFNLVLKPEREVVFVGGIYLKML